MKKPNDGSMFNWSDLAFFLELARQGRLAPTGRRLRVDHTTVSRRVAQLERALNCKLFDRTPEGFILADAGQRLLAYAETIEANAVTIMQNVGGVAADSSGTVRFATMEGIASLYLAGHMIEFHRHYPAITVEMVTAAHLLNLTRREADVSLSFVKPHGRKLSNERIGTFELRLYASPAYIERHGEPQNADELNHHVFVDYIDDLVLIQEVRWLADVIQNPRVMFRSSSMIAQQNAAAAGIGLVLLPSFAGACDSRLKAVLPGIVSVKRNLWLTVHQELQHTARVKALTRFMTELIKRDQPYLNGLKPWPTPKENAKSRL